ncbi:hypothetical protein Pmani_036803 [Petrolisthes manimaculis]|uniref:Uncharacterized protein n=1 Tax=Petrolisthes manimaculis TaxID=1843537 RepID=A0AAE1NJF3_9EUCA|nr:hypothetical protein Pmani_036803 [Petrolisthes manimaculis]
MAATRTRHHVICNPSTSTLSPLHPRCMSGWLVRRHKKLRLWKYSREAGLVETMLGRVRSFNFYIIELCRPTRCSPQTQTNLHASICCFQEDFPAVFHTTIVNTSRTVYCGCLSFQW